MKQLTLLLAGALISLLLLVCSLNATAQVSNSTGVSASKCVLVHISGNPVKKNIRASFDTAGATIGELSEAQLNEKFDKAESTAAILNFVMQNGYKIVGFSSLSAAVGNGYGGGFNGYSVVFEQLK